jgi:hypothetical protein
MAVNGWEKAATTSARLWPMALPNRYIHVGTIKAKATDDIVIDQW